MLHPPLSISAEPVKAQTVLCLVDLVEKSRSQFRPLCGINLTFEYRILYTLAQIETSAGHATKTATAAGILRVDIIGNEHQHRSFPYEWRVADQVASQMARQPQGLNMWNKSHQHRFATTRMKQSAL